MSPHTEDRHLERLLEAVRAAARADQAPTGT
jgi:hypothetical protein